MAAHLGHHRVWTASVALVFVAGCTSTLGDNHHDAADPVPVVQTGKLDASVTQNRFAEGTRELLAGVSNNTDREVSISSASIRWRGLQFPTVRIDDPRTPPGHTAAFDVTYGNPSCDTQEPGQPTMVTVVNGGPVVLPLRVESPGLLQRLRDKACGEEALDAVASVSLRLSERTQTVGGEEVLPGRVVVRRRTDLRDQVTVDELGGSVLFAVEPRGGSRALPARLGPGQRLLSVQVLVRSNGRCDEHSRSQSSQTFLFSVYAHRGTDATQRLVQIPDVADQERLLRMLDRVCA